MALDKLTLFEVHLDGAQIGPKSVGGTPDVADEEMETGMETGTTDEIEMEASESESGGSRRLLALVVGVVALVAVAAWRRRGGDQTTMDEYADAEDGLADSESVDA